MITDFGRINHWKRLVNFNTLFGKCDCSLLVKEDILLQSGRMKPQNKVGI